MASPEMFAWVHLKVCFDLARADLSLQSSVRETNQRMESLGRVRVRDGRKTTLTQIGIHNTFSK